MEEVFKIKQPKMLHIADKHFNVIHEHLAVGSGELDFNYIFSEVLKDFHGSIIFEVVDEDAEIIKSKNIIREILERNS